jgi:hypothetical protein
MVRPALQGKVVRGKKEIAPIYPAFNKRLFFPQALMESAHSDLNSLTVSKDPSHRRVRFGPAFAISHISLR